MSAYLEVKDLKKYFKTPRGMLHAVDGLNFSIEKGHTLGVVGESGCGKSTLGRTIIGLLDATGGQVIFEGKDITNADKAERMELRKKMQIIFQDPFSSLNPRMTVSEAIAEGLIIHKVCKTKQELDQRVSELMDTVGLAERGSEVLDHRDEVFVVRVVGVAVYRLHAAVEPDARAAFQGAVHALHLGVEGGDGLRDLLLFVDLREIRVAHEAEREIPREGFLLKHNVLLG